MKQPLIEQVFIRCDPTTAFDLLADVRNETRWNQGVSVAELRAMIRFGRARDSSPCTAG